MRSRNVILTLLLLVFIFLVAIIRKWQEPPAAEAFNRAPDQIRFYAFALCRMRCLNISEADVKTVLERGIININRSNRLVRPCPLFAVQARVRSGYVRVVYEQCRNATYVVNCYNLQRNSPCACEADYKPKTN